MAEDFTAVAGFMVEEGFTGVEGSAAEGSMEVDGEEDFTVGADSMAGWGSVAATRFVVAPAFAAAFVVVFVTASDLVGAGADEAGVGVGVGVLA